MNEQSLRILIIDDDVAVCDVAQRVLRRAGFDVAGAHDAVAGLRAAREMEPDAILLDLKMPRVDGSEAVWLLRALPATKYAVIIAFTGLIDPSGLRLRGFDAVIPKPTFAFDLVDRVVRALHSKSALERRGVGMQDLLEIAQLRLRSA